MTGPAVRTPNGGNTNNAAPKGERETKSRLVLNPTAVEVIRASRVRRRRPMECRKREPAGLRPSGNDEKGTGLLRRSHGNIQVSAWETCRRRFSRLMPLAQRMMSQMTANSSTRYPITTRARSVPITVNSRPIQKVRI